jgi:hypothetical protein
MSPAVRKMETSNMIEPNRRPAAIACRRFHISWRFSLAEETFFVYSFSVTKNPIDESY